MSRANLKLNEVYGTSRNVPATYVSRTDVDERFLNDITRDKHIVIHGSSKQGKTCLRKQNLNSADYIVIQCTRETTKAKLYEMLFKQTGIPCEVTESKTVGGGWKLQVKVAGEGGIPWISKASGEGGGEYERQSNKESTYKAFEIDPEDPNDVARILKQAEFNKYIVIEDFHYLDSNVQQSIAIDLKVFHENSNLVFIIVGVWLEADRLSMYNGDLRGRLVTINVDSWTEPYLLKVIETGEPLLNIAIPKNVKEAAIKVCQGNVGLLQELIYRICEKHGIWGPQNVCQEVGNVDDVDAMLKALSEEQSAGYKNFLSRFSEGLGQTQLEMYKWLLFVVIKSGSYELRRGLRPNVIFQRIKAYHPSQTLQQMNVVQALQCVQKIQFKNGQQPLVLDYSNGELIVIDVNFIVFLQAHSQDELLRFIGFDQDFIDRANHDDIQMRSEIGSNSFNE